MRLTALQIYKLQMAHKLSGEVLAEIRAKELQKEEELRLLRNVQAAVQDLEGVLMQVEP